MTILPWKAGYGPAKLGAAVPRRLERTGGALLVAGLLLTPPASDLPAQTSPDGAGGGRVVSVVAHDFAFTLPDTLSAGLTTFRLKNDGRQPHHLMLYRLDPGKRLSDVLAALAAGGAHPGWMHAVGGPNAVPPGGESVGTVQLAPGSYVVFCHVKSPDQVIHFAKGMLKGLTVTPAAGAARPLPHADLTLTLRDYGFALSRPPAHGRQRILVRNAGTQAHEVILSRLAPGKRSRDFIRWLNTQEGRPPVVPWGGTTDLPPGGAMTIDVDLARGRYSLVCRVRDAVDGRPHDEHGMHTDLVVR